MTFLFLVFIFIFFIIFIEVYLIYDSVIVVSDVLQSESYIHFFFFKILSPIGHYRILSSLCYTAGSISFLFSYSSVYMSVLWNWASKWFWVDCIYVLRFLICLKAESLQRSQKSLNLLQSNCNLLTTPKQILLHNWHIPIDLSKIFFFFKSFQCVICFSVIAFPPHSLPLVN